MTLLGLASVAFAGAARSVGVRIHDGGSRGVLQMNVDNGGWDAVCDDSFDDNEADVVCQHLGYAGGTAYAATHGDDSFAVDDLNCPDGAADLSECATLRQPYVDDCSGDETVGIECSVSGYACTCDNAGYYGDTTTNTAASCIEKTCDDTDGASTAADCGTGASCGEGGSGDGYTCTCDAGF
eukprot:COSAG03_NODE_12483_length_545_cov_0.834081_1_plen_181_part_11